MRQTDVAGPEIITAEPAAAPAAPSAALLARAAARDPVAFRALQATLPNSRLQRLAAPSQRISRDGGATEVKTGAAADKEATDKWAKAGPFGDDIYKLIADLLTPGEIAGLIKKVPPAVAEGVGGAIDAETEKKMQQALGMGAADVKKAIEGGGVWASKAAEEWLKGPKGQKVVAAVKKHVGEHASAYYQGLALLVATAIGVAVTLYATGNLDPPKLEKEIKLSEAVKLKGSVDLGKPQEFWLGSAGLGLSWQLNKRWSMGWDSTLTGGKEGKYGNYGLGGNYQLKFLSEDLKTTDFSARVGGNYSWITGAYGFDAGLTGGPIGLGYGLAYNPATDKKPEDTLHTFKGTAQVIKEKLAIEVKGVMSESGKADTIGGSASGKAGNFNYAAGMTWDLSGEQLKSLTASLGFKNEKETLTWLASVAAELKDDAYTISGNAALKAVIGSYVLRIEGKLSGTDKEGIKSFGAAAALKIPLPHELFISPSLGIGYGTYSRLGEGAPPTWMITPGVGFGWKELPVVPTFQWNQPIGDSGLTGFPSLGITGSFDETKLFR
jgi:hypothetical protein